MQFTELASILPGRIFRSAMPLSRSYDPAGSIYQAYKENYVHTIVVLAPDDEALRCTGIYLRARYQQDGFEVIYLPVTDFSTPAVDDLRACVSAVLNELEAGHNIAVHCHAGVGRTGLFLSCLLKQMYQLSGDEAIQRVRQYVPEAVETDEQQRLVELI